MKGKGARRRTENRGSLTRRTSTWFKRTLEKKSRKRRGCRESLIKKIRHPWYLTMRINNLEQLWSSKTMMMHSISIMRLSIRAQGNVLSLQPIAASLSRMLMPSQFNATRKSSVNLPLSVLKSGRIRKQLQSWRIRAILLLMKASREFTMLMSLTINLPLKRIYLSWKLIYPNVYKSVLESK